MIKTTDMYVALKAIAQEDEVHTKLNQERLCCKFQDIAMKAMEKYDEDLLSKSRKLLGGLKDDDVYVTLTEFNDTVKKLIKELGLDKIKLVTVPRLDYIPAQLIRRVDDILDPKRKDRPKDEPDPTFRIHLSPEILEVLHNTAIIKVDTWQQTLA